MKKPGIRGQIDASLEKVAEKLTAEGRIDVAFVERQHVEAMARCRIAGDRTNEREHLECIGRMKGAYDVGLHVDLTVKHEYDERLAVEAHRLARLVIEEAGAGGLVPARIAPGAPEGQQDGLQSRTFIPVGEGVGGEGEACFRGDP